MKYTQIPADTFKNLQMNAGILVKDFVPETGEFTNIMGATSGGVNFNATPTYTDNGEDIDNCPKNTMELMRLDTWTATMSGSFKSVTPDLVTSLLGAVKGGTDTTHIVPSNILETTAFKDVWWVGDYSDVNTGKNAGFLAIHLMNALSTNGLQIQSADKAKGTFSFNYVAHYSTKSIDTVPFEIYIQSGVPETSEPTEPDAGEEEGA